MPSPTKILFAADAAYDRVVGEHRFFGGRLGDGDGDGGGGRERVLKHCRHTRSGDAATRDGIDRCSSIPKPQAGCSLSLSPFTPP